MPSSIWYLGVMLAVICVWFMLLKRPMYESAMVSFLVLLTISGTWSNVWVYLTDTLSTSLLYSMVAFVAMSVLLTKTKVIDSCIALILSVVGRVSGGAGYSAVVASAFMGALSGSGPGNVMASGAITIPAMKRSGFPAHLAANIESNASCLGNMIPPSSNIMAAMGAYAAVCPNLEVSQGQFWMVLWGISACFILHRILMVFAFCRYYKVKPMSKEELPSFRETLRTGWQALFLPVVILLPFVLDFLFKDNFFTQQLGKTGAKAFSSSVLLFTGGLATIFGCLVTKNKSLVTPNAIAKTFGNAVKSIVPTIAVCFFSYLIGALFADLNMAEELGAVIGAWNFSKPVMIIMICLITCFMGMVITGSSMIVIFGAMYITILKEVGVDPLLAAAMLPCICGVMSQITPPTALCMYAGMSIAESDFGATVKNNMWWVVTQFALQIVILMGWLPILGL